MQLRKRMKNEERTFCAELYQKYKYTMFSKAREYDNSHTNVEDIVQEAVIRLAKHLEKLRGMDEGAQVVYIVFTVRSTAFNLNNKLAREREVIYDGYSKDIDLSSWSAEESVMLRAKKEDVERVLAMLPERDNLLLTGKYIVELSDEELAEMIGCKPGSIRMMLTRARGKARELFTKEGITIE